MNRVQLEHCMEQVQAYRASGMKAKAWAQANGVAPDMLSSWCGHYARWQAKLQSGGAVAGAAPAQQPASGFVAARVAAPGTGASVRIEMNTAAARLDLHWPLAHARELAAFVRELAR